MYAHLLAIVLMSGGSADQPSVQKSDGSPMDRSRIEKLIQQLDAHNFADREAAARELDRLGSLALPYLRKVLETKPSLEMRRRAEALIGTIERRDPAYVRDMCEALISQLDADAHGEVIGPSVGTRPRNDQAESAAAELLAFGPAALPHLRRAKADHGLSPMVRAKAHDLIASIQRTACLAPSKEDVDPPRKYPSPK